MYEYKTKLAGYAVNLFARFAKLSSIASSRLKNIWPDIRPKNPDTYWNIGSGIMCGLSAFLLWSLICGVGKANKPLSAIGYGAIHYSQPLSIISAGVNEVGCSELIIQGNK